MVRQRSAKPLFAGSIPAVASIRVPPDFSFPATVVSHGWYLLAPFHWSRTERALERVELLGGEPRHLTITFADGALQIAGAESWGAAALGGAFAPLTGEGAGAPSDELRMKMARMFQLDVNIAEFFKVARASPDHSWVESAGFGRLLCGSTLFEDAVKIITTTNTTWRQTMRMVALLVENCGRGGAFPEPEDIARFRVETLQRRCRLGYRAKTIHALASGIIRGTIDLARIADPLQATEELFAAYRTLPGIGPYGSAHLLAMDGRHDVIAVDSEFRRFVCQTHHRGRKVADRTLLRRYAKWGRWKYLAYWSELWKSVAEQLETFENADQ